MVGNCAECGKKCHQKADDGKFYCDICWIAWTTASDEERKEWEAAKYSGSSSATLQELTRSKEEEKAKAEAEQKEAEQEIKAKAYWKEKQAAFDVLAAQPTLEPPPREVPCPVVFWGICDLKYDPSLPETDRVKVLELGDGRASRFSHDGAFIKQRFEERYVMDPVPIRCQVMVDNKKFTHDKFVDSGFAHLRPKQMYYPRRYASDLAARIITDLGVSSSGVVVLKLVNRARGAGVVVCPVPSLDDTLRRLLCPPLRKEFNVWREKRQLTALKIQEPADFLDEHEVHFWSNECPFFVVEELCHSMPVPMTSLGDAQNDSADEHVGFDGTMRVAFALTRLSSTNERFELHWLGGYWKLPPSPARSTYHNGALEEVHSSMVSSFNTEEKRTAPVKAEHLLDVYATLMPALPKVFAAGNVGLKELVSCYPQDLSFRAFVMTRYAAVIRNSGDWGKSWRTLEQASRLVKVPQVNNLLDCLPEKSVHAYIDRSMGVYHALRGDWKKAAGYFQEAMWRMQYNSTAHYLRAMAYQLEGKFKDAVDLHLISIVLDPDFRSPLMALGECFMELGEYQKAIDACVLCLHRQPDAPVAQFYLGQALYAQLQGGVEVPLLSSAEIRDRRARIRRALEAARAGVPDKWTEVEDELLKRVQNEDPVTWPKQPLMVWRTYGWRP